MDTYFFACRLRSGEVLGVLEVRLVGSPRCSNSMFCAATFCLEVVLRVEGIDTGGLNTLVSFLGGVLAYVTEKILGSCRGRWPHHLYAKLVTTKPRPITF